MAASTGEPKSFWSDLGLGLGATLSNQLSRRIPEKEFEDELDEAFRILGAEDVKKQFGADTAWDVIESILVQHFNESLETSPRQRMAVAGREVLRWLAQPHVLQTQRAQFEALLLQIAEFAEEWLTSVQSLGIVRRRTDHDERVLRRGTVTVAPTRRAALNGARRP